MSTLKINKLVNLNDDGAVEFSKGLTLPSGYGLDPESYKINSSGIVTATTFYGAGTGITGLSGVSTKKAIALSFLQ